MNKRSGSFTSRKKCYDNPLNYFYIGFHRALATIDSATGLLMLETGISRAIDIGGHLYPFGLAMTCKRQVVNYTSNI